MQKVALASNNVQKILEMRELFQGVLELIPQSELQVNDVPETGLSFVENALIKARHAAQQTGLPALGDDSGIAVDALKGAPGIYSARFGGNCSIQEKRRKLIAEFKATGSTNKAASFYCALVYMRHANDQAPLITFGRWHGELLLTPTCEDGYGYEPCFYVLEYGKSVAELDREIKNQLSHRARAAEQLKPLLLHDIKTHY